jgi:hypothetical protein
LSFFIFHLALKSMGREPAQRVIRTVAAGERSEPADPDVCFWLSLRSWRQSLSPAHAGSQFFSNLVSPGSLRSPGAITLSRFALKLEEHGIFHLSFFIFHLALKSRENGSLRSG